MNKNNSQQNPANEVNRTNFALCRSRIKNDRTSSIWITAAIRIMGVPAAAYFKWDSPNMVNRRTINANQIAINTFRGGIW